jgi:hypothetical protein
VPASLAVDGDLLDIDITSTGYATCAYFSLQAPLTGTATVLLDGFGDTTARQYTWLGETYPDTGVRYPSSFEKWSQASAWVWGGGVDLASAGHTANYIGLCAYDDRYGQHGSTWTDRIRVKSTVDTCVPYDIQCDTVDDPNFNDTSAWLVADGANIISSTATISPGGVIAQNLTTLDSNTAYDVVLNISDVISPPVSLDVVFGVIQTATLTISDTGTYTATFTTPNLGGPLAYVLENSGSSGVIEIDSTCIYPADSDGKTCIAPSGPAGVFSSPDGWQWYRGAAFNELNGNAYLPYNPGGDNEKALIISTATYTMPTLAEGEYLKMSFLSKTENGRDGVLGARVANTAATTDTTYYYQVYANYYDFEADISSLAGEEVSLAFVNSGVDPVSDYSGDDNLFLDNVCVFVDDEELNLPEPVDPNPPGLPAVSSFGWNYTCADIPGILLGLGIDLSPLYLAYEEGPTLSNWYIWLAAALWVHLGEPIACFLLSLFGWLISLIEYLWAILQNWFFWLLRFAEATGQWLADVSTWLGQSLANISNWIGTNLTNHSNWLGLSLANVSSWAGNNLSNFSNWIGVSLANLAAWLGQLLSDAALWLGESLVNLAAWLGENLATLARWIALGATWLWVNVISEIVDLIVRLWNWLAGWLAALSFSTSSTTGLLSLIIGTSLDFVGAMWDLFWMLLSWLWENFFDLAGLPIQFYHAFNEGVSSDSFGYLLTCESENFWCQFLAGFELVNRTSSHSVAYPVVIVGIIIGTIVIFWRDIRRLFSITIQ